MDLKEILSISGKPGLFKIIAHTKSSVIVESFIDQRRIPVYTSDKITNMEDISIFTSDTEKPLKEVFKLIYDKENGGKSIDHKSDDKKLREYFEQILPDFDKERVHNSDIKKIFNWYNQLVTNNMLDFTEKTEKPVTEEKTVDTEAPSDEAKPKKKTKSKEENIKNEKPEKATPKAKKTAASGTKTGEKK